jgi:nitrile hydratase accessory protein
LSPSDAIEGRLKSRDGEPAFAEPWQAQAMAMARLLVEAGTISASEWADVLGDELQSATEAGSPDDHDTYYRAVISSLERILISGSHLSREELDHRKRDWELAYESTPHGQPVTL